jgi:hypothetical protein
MFTLSSNRTLVAQFEVIPPTQYTISVSANPSSYGNVSGGGTFNDGSSRTVTATANSGYRFVNWTENGSQVSTSASYMFTLSSNRTLVANFELIPPTPTYYTLTVNGGSGSGSYTAGTQISVVANAAPSGQIFDKWTGNTGGLANLNSASTTYTMGSAAATIEATYKNLPPPPSSDATLSGLSLDVTGLTPAFSPSVTNYTLTVVNSVTSVTISATANDGGATITGTGAFALIVGANVFTIKVTAEDGSVRIYTITVIRSDLPDGIEPIGSDIRIYTEGSTFYAKSENVSIKRIEIFSITGTKVYGNPVNNIETIINNLPKGILIVRVFLEEKTITQKVIVK